MANYGLLQTEDVNKRVAEVGIEEINSNIDAALRNYTAGSNALLRLFADYTTDFKGMYRAATATRPQPIGENGKALPVRPDAPYEVAYPLHINGNAWGANAITLEEMTVGDVQEQIVNMIGGDSMLLRERILAALFANSSWTFNDAKHGSLTIQGLANNDGTGYLKTDGIVDATANMYSAQSAAITDGDNPFPAIRNKLKGYSANSGDVVAFVSSSLVGSVSALTDFTERSDNTIITGAGVSVARDVPDEVSIGNYLGATNGVYVAEWSALPAGYIIAVTTDGEKPLRIRQKPVASLQGFVRLTNLQVANDHPFYESQYVRIMGVGAYNRVGAAVHQVGNATYQIPSGFSSPLA